jgi:hypothetical protein
LKGFGAWPDGIPRAVSVFCHRLVYKSKLCRPSAWEAAFLPLNYARTSRGLYAQNSAREIVLPEVFQIVETSSPELGFRRVRLFKRNYHGSIREGTNDSIVNLELPCEDYHD